jgi:hypothetical protein
MKNLFMYATILLLAILSGCQGKIHIEKTDKVQIDMINIERPDSDYRHLNYAANNKPVDETLSNTG